MYGSYTVMHEYFTMCCRSFSPLFSLQSQELVPHATTTIACHTSKSKFIHFHDSENPSHVHKLKQAWCPNPILTCKWIRLRRSKAPNKMPLYLQPSSAFDGQRRERQYAKQPLATKYIFFFLPANLSNLRPHTEHRATVTFVILLSEHRK